REDSPWYPTMRLFRQKELGEWDSVFARMAQEASLLISRSKGGGRDCPRTTSTRFGPIVTELKRIVDDLWQIENQYDRAAESGQPNPRLTLGWKHALDDLKRRLDSLARTPVDDPSLYLTLRSEPLSNEAVYRDTR